MEISFKLWLETDETHPFEKWHDEYQANRATRRKSFTSPLGVAKPEEMLKDPRARSLWAVRVLHVHGSTSGLHGYGDQPDVPASDPFRHAEWEVEIDSKIESQLVGKRAFILDKSSGSFHERWANVGIYVMSDNTGREQSISPGDYRRITKFFTFQSVRQAAELVEEMENNATPPTKEGETRDEYWQRMMQGISQEPEPDQSGYDPRDDYFKH